MEPPLVVQRPLANSRTLLRRLPSQQGQQARSSEPLAERLAATRGCHKLAITATLPFSTCRVPMTAKKKIGQVKNPRTGRYVKIDRDKGRIISHKPTKGPYKGVPVIRKKKSK